MWWRLLRIPYLEAALHAKGRAEDLTEVETWLKYEKQFRDLALQERRLSNYAIRLRAELEGCQAQRETEESAAEPESTLPQNLQASSKLCREEYRSSGFDFSVDAKNTTAEYSELRSTLPL